MNVPGSVTSSKLNKLYFLTKIPTNSYDTYSTPTTEGQKRSHNDLHNDSSTDTSSSLSNDSGRFAFNDHLKQIAKIDLIFMIVFTVKNKTCDNKSTSHLRQ